MENSSHSFSLREETKQKHISGETVHRRMPQDQNVSGCETEREGTGV